MIKEHQRVYNHYVKSIMIAATVLKGGTYLFLLKRAKYSNLVNQVETLLDTFYCKESV